MLIIRPLSFCFPLNPVFYIHIVPCVPVWNKDCISFSIPAVVSINFSYIRADIVSLPGKVAFEKTTLVKITISFYFLL